jgi:uncharacterized protein YbjT (DUF2867 family)
MLLITGAAGASGSLIVKALSQQGQRLRALIRNPEKAELFSGMQGVEVQVADLARPQTLGRALDGVDTALLISSSDERMLETQCAFVDAARASGVRRIVKLSGKESGIGFDAKAFRFTRMHEEIEAHIERPGLRWTHLRPSQFMQVYLREAPSIAKAGVLALPAGDIELCPVDLADIASIAAAVLADDQVDGRRLVDYRSPGLDDARSGARDRRSHRTQCLVPARHNRRARRPPEVRGHAADRDRRPGGTGCRAAAPPPLDCGPVDTRTLRGAGHHLRAIRQETPCDFQRVELKQFDRIARTSVIADKKPTSRSRAADIRR